MSLVKKYDKGTQIWFMSDLHLGHSKDFIWEKRGFSSVQEHNETLLKNIKECVDANDEFYILGDLILGPLEDTASLLAQIPGHVHIILGNHDTDRRVEFYESLGWDVQFATIIRWGIYRFYLSHYPTNCDNGDKKYLSQRLLNIYGHTHQETAWFAQNPNAYCVCPEANENRPIAISDIVCCLITANVFHLAKL